MSSAFSADKGQRRPWSGGLVLAHVLAVEIGRIERFGHHKALASYSLLAPRADDTGEAGFVDTLAGGKTLRFTHRGPYAGLMGTYGQITQFMLAKGRMESEADWARYMPMWEEYLNDPETTPEEELLTHIYLPVP